MELQFQQRPGELLSTHQVVRTRDVLEAHTGLTRLFSPHSLETGRSTTRDFHARANSAVIGSVRLVYLALGVDAVIRPEPLQDYYAANIIVAGSAEVRRDAEVTRAGGRWAGSVLTPDADVSMRWDDACEQLSVLIDRDVVESFHAATCGVGRAKAPDLAAALDLRSAAVKSWIALVRWVTSDIGHGGGLLESPTAAARVEELLIAGLLTAQGRGDAGADIGESPVPARIRRAVRLVEEHADEELTIARLAQVAGVGVRTLQLGFQEHVGMSPSAYLRDVRLDRARAELESGGRDERTTVTSVAQRWGFAHVPRFAGAYRHKFGVLPSETLRLSRSRTGRS
jgi:AraC-like DNA-binding protein